MHARTSSPSSSTEHAPHCAIPQPRRGPVNFSSLRSTNSKGVSGAADTTCFVPFTDSVISFAMICLPSSQISRHLEQQAIPHAAIPNCTNHFSVVNTLRESGFDSACSIEGFQLFGGEFQIQTGEIFLELRYLPRSNDRDYWHRLMPQPGECYLRHAATGLFGDRLHSRKDPRRAWSLRKEVLHSLVGHPPDVSLAFAVILPGQHATRQRRPSQNSQVQSFRHGNQFALDRSLDEAVLDLQPDKLCPASKLRQSVCLGDPPSGSV